MSAYPSSIVEPYITLVGHFITQLYRQVTSTLLQKATKKQAICRLRGLDIFQMPWIQPSWASHVRQAASSPNLQPHSRFLVFFTSHCSKSGPILTSPSLRNSGRGRIVRFRVLAFGLEIQTSACTKFEYNGSRMFAQNCYNLNCLHSYKYS